MLYHEHPLWERSGGGNASDRYLLNDPSNETMVEIAKIGSIIPCLLSLGTRSD
jgi:hypothetical protein